MISPYRSSRSTHSLAPWTAPKASWCRKALRLWWGDSIFIPSVLQRWAWRNARERAKIQARGVPVASTAPVRNNMLVWDNGAWSPRITSSGGDGIDGGPGWSPSYYSRANDDGGGSDRGPR